MRILVPLLLSACAVRPDVVEVSNLVVSDDALTIAAPLGTAQSVDVSLTNTGTASALVRIQTTAPVSGPASVTLGPDTTRIVALTVAPNALVQQTVTVQFLTERQTRSLDLIVDVITDVDNDGFPSIAAGGTDCDDTRSDVFPGATERCNGRDDDCDGVIDTDTVDAPMWYVDADADTWGATTPGLSRCTPPLGHVARTGDCNDSNPNMNPGRTEVYYDGVDADCDGASDYDADGDGYDSIGWSGTDCRDSDPAVHPGAPEVLGDGIDQDCDGVVDERAPATGELMVTEVHPEPILGPAFVEITSRTASPLALDQLAVVASSAHVLPQSTALEPFGVFVVCDASAPFCDTVLPTLTLDDATELRIGVPALDILPLATLPWTVGASAEYAAASGPDGNDDAAAWCTAVSDDSGADAGTPGSRTPSCALP